MAQEQHTTVERQHKLLTLMHWEEMHEYTIVLANGDHFKGHTHCCLGMVPTALCKKNLAVLTIATAGMLAYRANQTAEELSTQASTCCTNHP